MPINADSTPHGHGGRDDPAQGLAGKVGLDDDLADAGKGATLDQSELAGSGEGADPADLGDLGDVLDDLRNAGTGAAATKAGADDELFASGKASTVVGHETDTDLDDAIGASKEGLDVGLDKSVFDDAHLKDLEADDALQPVKGLDDADLDDSDDVDIDCD